MPTSDVLKFRSFLIVCAGLILCILAASLLQEYFMPDIAGYLERKNYYEQVVEKKGLTLHPAVYWKEKR